MRAVEKKNTHNHYTLNFECSFSPPLLLSLTLSAAYLMICKCFAKKVPVNLEGRQNLITTSALDKHSSEFYVVSWNPRTGCSDALITLSHLEVKADIKYFKSNSIKCCVLTAHSLPLSCAVDG